MSLNFKSTFRNLPLEKVEPNLNLPLEKVEPKNLNIIYFLFIFESSLSIFALISLVDGFITLT